MDLRPYQIDALARVERAAARGVRRQLGVAATGLGKTVIFCALARQMGVRTLVIAHRDELIEQAAAKVAEVWPGVEVGVVKGQRDEVTAAVVVGSVQTLSRPKRLARLIAPGELLGDVAPFGLVVVDEAHHAAAKSYRDVLHGLRCHEPDGPLLLGVTATPDRGDGKGLDDLFEEVVFSYDIRWGIAQDYLSDLRGMRVSLDMDLGGLRLRGGDYDAGQAGAMLEAADAPTAIVKAWTQQAAGRRTLVFTPTVAVAEACAVAFNQAGVAAAAVSGETPMEDRREILAAYSRGDLDVVANCAVLTEGYDEPRTDCIVVARPTKSRALYAQMVGRGTRRHPDKTDCLVLDVVGATEEHTLVTVPSLFGIEQPEKVWDTERTVTDVLHEQIELQRVEGRLLATEARLFDKVRESSRMAWHQAHRAGAPRRYELDLAKSGRMVLVEVAPDQYRAGYQDYAGVKRVLIDSVSLELAQGVAEDLVRKLGAANLVDTNAAWRSSRASRKQREAATRFGITLPVGCTKGEASDLIGAHLAKLRSRREQPA